MSRSERIGSRSQRLGRVAALGLAGGLLAALAGCGGSSATSLPDAPQVASSFLDAYAAGNLTKAASETNSSSVALTALTAARSALKPVSVSSKVGDTQVKDHSASTDFALDWNFGPGRVWHDASKLALTEDNNGNWLVTWSPSILAAGLRQGQSLIMDNNSEPQLPTVLGSDGSTLLSPSEVVDVNLTADKAGNLAVAAGSLASALNQFDSTITSQSIMAKANTTTPGPELVVTLREADYQKVKPQIYNLPGVTFVARQTLLAPTRTFGSAILPTIRDFVARQAGTSGGFTIAIRDADGTTGTTLYTAPMSTTPLAPIRTTLNSKIQTAAETALATVPQQAMAVVIQPSTGDILAVAENSAASANGDNPLTGLYPPGSTFKIITLSAGLSAGTLTAQQSVACPGTTTIEGRVIPNEGKFDLGTTSLVNAFAQSCNTTFSQVAAGMSATELPSEAKKFGIGVNYTIPHVTTNTGSITNDSDVLGRAEDGFGQGKDQVTPFGMALVAATAAHGSTPLPSLIVGQTTHSDTSPSPIPAGLKPMMRAVVTDGTGKALAGISPPVYGKTGTAQYGDGSHSHGWFVGYQGDLAFAFLLVDAGTSAVAVPVAGTFLKAAA